MSRSPLTARASIVTLTMNPALDVTADAEEVHHTSKIRCGDERYDAGGGGVNVARFVHALGGSVAAVFSAGGLTGSRLIDLVDEAGVPNIPVPVAGSTRESFTVNERSTGKQYRFVLPGPRLTAEEQRRCLDVLRATAATAQYIVASGSLPPGVAPDFYARVADVCAESGCRLILDTSGGGLSHVTSGVYLLKPSVRELRECMDRALSTEGDQVAAARELVQRGLAQAVVVSLGPDGVLLVTDDDSQRFSALPVQVVSGVGAGDAMVAGITVALSRGWSLTEAVRYGIAASAAKLLTPGTSCFTAADVDRLFGRVAGPASVVRATALAD